MMLIWASFQASGILLLKITLNASEKATTQLSTIKGWMWSVPGDFLGLKRNILADTIGRKYVDINLAL